MADKPNMYRGLAKEQEIMKEKMKKSAVIHYNSEGIPDGIPMYRVESAKEIRDDVATLMGKLEMAVKGLEKESTRKPYYEDGLKWCEVFLRMTKDDK